MGDELAINKTSIPGLLLLKVPVHGDNRGWFKENWQREKMVALGLPDFGPVQHNISYNEKRGTTRGIHAEPWDKFISVATGSVFSAWVDLREGSTFGTVFTTVLAAGDAIYVPKGLGNSYQTLEDHTAYTYLVNDHWSPEAEYVFVNLADPTLDIRWPLGLDQAEISAKDLTHPPLSEVKPIRTDSKDPDSERTLILGANGQLGRELKKRLPNATAWAREVFDVGDPLAHERVDWSQFDVVINAAAYTKVDEAETVAGRREAWRINAHGPTYLARSAIKHDLRLVHISTDYVFDGERTTHSVDEEFAPLAAYGASKAAGDLAVSLAPRHLIVRTSWVIGDGPNFVRTMQDLAARGVDPKVVDDQVGRLSFVEDIAKEILRLLGSTFIGTINVTSGGQPRSWFEIAQSVYRDAGHDPARVTSTTTAEFVSGRSSIAARPRFSTLE